MSYFSTFSEVTKCPFKIWFSLAREALRPIAGSLRL